MNNKKLIYIGLGAVMLSAISFRLGVILSTKPVPQLADGKELVAKIDGKDFTAEDLYDALKVKGGQYITINMIDEWITDKEVAETDEIKKQAQNELEVYKLQTTQSGNDWEDTLTNAGFATEKDFLEYLVIELRKGEVVKNFLEKALTTKEIDAYYENSISGEVVAKHILIQPADTTGKTDAEKAKALEDALKEANEVIAKLKAGESWSSLVTKYSDDTGTKANDGQLTFVKTDVVAEFYNGAVALEDGKYSTSPVKSQYGYHIIYKVSEKAKPTKEAAMTDIKDALVSNKLNADTTLSTKTWIKIRKAYNMELFEANIKKDYEASIVGY